MQRGWIGPLAIACVAITLTACARGPVEGTVPWSLVRSSPQSESIVVQVFRSGCDTADGARAVTHGRSVVVTVQAARHSGNCSEDMHTDLVRVRLGAPLGDRRLRGQCDPKRLTGICDPEPVAHVPSHLEVFGP